MSDDRQILTTAIEAAHSAVVQLNRGLGLLGRTIHHDSVLDPLAAAIGRTNAYRKVEGRALFSGNAGVVLHSSSLAVRVLNEIAFSDDPSVDTSKAADRLIRVLSTEHADGRLVTALWGVKVDRPIKIGKGTMLIPLEQLGASAMKDRVLRSANEAWDRSVWSWDRYFDVPGAAIVVRIKKLPYIGHPDKAFKALQTREAEIRGHLSLIQACGTGQPVVAGNWFEYDDQELDINSHENHISWMLPEVVPLVKAHVEIKAAEFERDLKHFQKLASGQQRVLVRSMRRFALSQCRHDMSDQAIDLAIAFEILTGGGGNAAISWKVAVRAAQFVGGTPQERMRYREVMSELYSLRSTAAHGGNADRAARGIIDEATVVYRLLVGACMTHGITTAKAWAAIEMGDGPTSEFCLPERNGV